MARLVVSLDATSPFPSPSSSFLTPPTPGAHEFAVKPPPPARRASAAVPHNSTHTSPAPSPRSSTGSQSSRSECVRALPDVHSSCDPLPSIPPPPTPSTPPPTQLPLPSTLEVPPPSPSAPRLRTNPVNRGSRPLSTASTASTTSACSSASAFDPSLFSSRPAPPSPGAGSPFSLSRKQSTRSKSGSKPVSRANSLRHHRGSSHASLVNIAPTLAVRGEGAASPHTHRVSTGSTRTFSSSPLASPSRPNFDMGITASSPAIQDIIATSISSEGSSGSPSTISTSISTADTQLQAPSPPPDEQKVFIKIRDFAFQTSDERHNGQGPFVPKPNRVGRMNRRLGGRSSSISSSDGDAVDDDNDDNDDGWGWNQGGYGTRGFGYGGGWVGGRFSWAVSSGAGAATAATIFDQEKAYAAAAANLSAAASKANGNDDGYPSRSELDRNFLDSESDEFYDAEDNAGLYDDDVEEEATFGDASSGVDDDDEPLYPGLYRAMYAFEPEGTAEMRLVEDQIVRVVGRGGGVGWAVVVAEPREEGMVEGADFVGDGGGALKSAMRHALVPESYLEPYRLDWELDEGEGATNRRTA